MKTHLLLLVSSSLSLAISPKDKRPVSYAGGDGSSIEKAVVIKGATEETGVDAEYAYLRQHYPGYHLKKQSLQGGGKRSYDVLDFTTADGKAKLIYFDITEFFGK